MVPSPTVSALTAPKTLKAITMNEPFITSDRHDKDNPNIQFTPPVHYTKEEVKAGEKLVTVINDAALSEADKKDKVWHILNSL